MGACYGHLPPGAATHQYDAPDTPPILCANLGQAETIIAAVGLWLPGLVGHEPKRDSCRTSMHGHIVTVPAGRRPWQMPGPAADSQLNSEGTAIIAFAKKLYDPSNNSQPEKGRARRMCAN